jgi:uncharacterized protein
MTESGYFSDMMPQPLAEPSTAYFWQGCAARELRIQKCASCGAHRATPVPICSHCHCLEYEWEVSRGEGHVFSYTIVHHSVHPSTHERVPYNVCVVELDDCGGVLVTSNVIGCADEDLRVGTPVELVWDRVTEDLWLYRFTPRRPEPPAGNGTRT